MPTTTKGLLGKLHEIQTEGIEGVTKDARNPHFKNSYITLSRLLEKVTPVLNAKGLLLIQTPTSIMGEPGLRTAIVDVDTGETAEGEVPLMLEKSNPQGLGSAITYARRYALMSMLALVADDDDDGQAASPVREVVNAKPATETAKPLF